MDIILVECILEDGTPSKFVQLNGGMRVCDATKLLLEKNNKQSDPDAHRFAFRVRRDGGGYETLHDSQTLSSLARSVCSFGW